VYNQDMSEALGYTEKAEPPAMTDMEYLHGLGYSFITPAKLARKRKAERMLMLDEYRWANPQERRAKVIATAYYALELSTPLPPLDEAMSALEKMDTQDRETAEKIIDELTVAWKVDDLLAQAYDRTADAVFLHLERLRELTDDYTAENTGTLKALADMSRSVGKNVGTISPISARHSEVLLREMIAREIGMDIEQESQES
jgi:hypothetical protein